MCVCVCVKVKEDIIRHSYSPLCPSPPYVTPLLFSPLFSSSSLPLLLLSPLLLLISPLTPLFFSPLYSPSSHLNSFKLCLLFPTLLLSIHFSLLLLSILVFFSLLFSFLPLPSSLLSFPDFHSFRSTFLTSFFDGFLSSPLYRPLLSPLFSFVICTADRRSTGK